MSKNSVSKRTICRKPRFTDVADLEQVKKWLFEERLTLKEVAKRYGFRSSSTVRGFLRDNLVEYNPEWKYNNSMLARSIYDRKLTRKQRSVVVGTALGDGRLVRPGINAQLLQGHGQRQKEYLDWKIYELQPFFAAQPRLERDGVFRVSSICHPVFNEFFELFYTNGVKVVPEDMRQLLDPLAIAVWYMDDGGTKTYSTRSSSFSSCSFTWKENEYLVAALAAFGLYAEVRPLRSRGNVYPTLVLFRESHFKLHEMIDPLIHDCLAYKRLD